MVLPPPVVSNTGCGDCEGEDIGPQETEYGRAIRCNTTISGPLRGIGATGGITGPPKMVGAEGDRLETGTGEDITRGDGGNDNRHGRGGDNGAGSGGNIGVRHRIGGGEGGGGVTGSQWLQWGEVEQGGDRVKTDQISTTRDTRDYLHGGDDVGAVGDTAVMGWGRTQRCLGCFTSP